MGKRPTSGRKADRGGDAGTSAILRVALGLLLRPYEEAERRGVPAWEVAATRETLKGQGLNDGLLLRLLELGLVDQRLDRVVLTEGGAEVARGRSDPGQGLPAPHVAGELIVPFYDVDQRILWYAGRLVKRLRQQADVQEIVLRAFQRQGWPRALKNPLPKGSMIPMDARLHAVVRGLMNAQKEARIRFFRNGTGCMICWEAVGPAKKKRA